MKEHPFVHMPATLQGVPFLSQLDEGTLEALLRDSSLREYEAGESVIDEGKDSNAFYVLLRGVVRVSKDGTEVGEISGRGETFGELSLLEGAQRSATVTAAEKVFCLRVGRESLDDLGGDQKMAYQAALYRFLADILVERLHATNERLASVESELRTARGD